MSDLPLYTAGKPLDEARAVLILLHGRGATASSILPLANELYHEDFAYLAPQAAGNSWYPRSFLAPLDENEPSLSAALAAVEAVLARVIGAGLDADRVVIGGFSQGACLAAEFAARYAQRLGGLIVFSGGLIGPPGTLHEYAGSLDGTPAFIGCGDADAHIPVERVTETTAVLVAMGGHVTQRIYPGMGHTINEDELDHARQIIQTVADS